MTSTPDPTAAVTVDPAVDLAALDLDALRAYRSRLQAEEERVSYWRRLVHARTDLLGTGRGPGGSLALDQLVRALGDTGSGATRSALLRVRAQEPLPDLPDLAEVWAVPADDAEVEAVLARLAEAEATLTGYRRALFDRLDAATAELVGRYRAEPALALSVLA